MLTGIYDDNGQKLNAEKCICRYKELSDVYCPVNGHTPFYDQGIPSVSQIVDGQDICSLKPWFAYNFPVYQHYRAVYPLLRGKVYHKALLTTVQLKEMLLLDRTNGILWGGHVDAYDPCEGTLYEMKTKRALPYSVPPWEYHQVLLYDYLLAGQGYDVKRYKFYYFTYEEYKDITVNPEKIPEDLVATWLEDTLKHMVTLDGEFKVAWGCQYCLYYRYCPVGAKYLRSSWAEKVENARKRRTQAFLIPPTMRPNDTKPITPEEWLSNPGLDTGTLLSLGTKAPDMKLPDGFEELERPYERYPQHEAMKAVRGGY